MEIRDGLLRTIPESSGELDIASEESPNHGGEFRAGRPDTIVIHYIDSLKLARQLFLDSTKKLSAHLVVDRAERRVVQMVDFSTIAWHAGRSSHEGRDGLNPYSIGIEVVNAGKLSPLRGNSYKSWVGDIYSDDQVFEDEKGSFWHIYDGDQVRLVYDICDLLVKVYNIQHIVGHNEIAPGRKIDPGPAFPLDRFRQELLYYDLSEDEPAEFEPVDGEVAADLLNVREFPNTTAKKVTDPLKRGTRVRIMGERSGWYEVEISERGWVSKEYVSTPDKKKRES